MTGSGNALGASMSLSRRAQATAGFLTGAVTGQSQEAARDDQAFKKRAVPKPRLY